MYINTTNNPHDTQKQYTSSLPIFTMTSPSDHDAVGLVLATTAVEEDYNEEWFGEHQFYGTDVVDCPPDQTDDEFQYLNEADLRSIQESDGLNWNDRLISDPDEEIIFVLDEAKKEAWSSFKEEVKHIRSISIPMLLKLAPDTTVNDISLKEIIDAAFGKSSDFATIFCNELGLDRGSFVKFMANLCLQMTYRETPSCLYGKYSLLQDKTVMDEQSYMAIWEKIATLKKVSLNCYVGSSRRGKCLWESLESTVNNFLRDVSIVGRTDEISVALDDDKIWVQSSGKNEDDHFGLRKVTHVKDNRKGIIAHTAVSSSTNMPLNFMFERKGDRAVDCFMTIFSKLFPSNHGGAAGSLPDLFGITNHSDRGYTLESTIFDFLVPAGADFTNTVKRIMPFPFIWGMKPTANETRTKLDEKGAPALFVKEVRKHNRLITCAAFRTGTQNISAVITSTIRGHQWEGICLNQKHRIMYENDPKNGLDSFLFKRLAGYQSLIEVHQDEMKVMLDELKEEKIDILTMEQGTADWHKCRQFSLTSSQSSGSFQMAFILFQEDNDWCNVAEHLHGEKYYESKYHSPFLIFQNNILLINLHCSKMILLTSF